MRQIYVYETTDGKTFRVEVQAEKHQLELDKEKDKRSHLKNWLQKRQKAAEADIESGINLVSKAVFDLHLTINGGQPGQPHCGELGDDPEYEDFDGNVLQQFKDEVAYFVREAKQVVEAL